MLRNVLAYVGSFVGTNRSTFSLAQHLACYSNTMPYLLDNLALADVLFPELEHRAQDLDVSSDSGSEWDVLEAFVCPAFSSACGVKPAISR
jgi:hypothetical protein